MFALNPGCCCEPGETCTIYSDLFERSDSSSLGADWTEVVSDLEISSGAVIRTGGTNPFAISTTTHSSHEMRIDMTVEATTSGSKFRIIMGYVDTNNYYFAELTIGSNIVLYRRSGGTNTSIGSLSIFSATGSPFTWWACMRGSFFSSGIGDITDPATAVHSTTSGSSGFGWGSTTSGMQVHSITSSILSPSCAYCYGWSCDGVCDPSFEVPTQLRVTISGMANGDGSGGTPCTSCASVEGEYILTATGPCTWCYQSSDTVCADCPFWVKIQIADFGVGGVIRLEIHFPDSPCPADCTLGFGDSIVWTAALGPDVNCSTLEDVALSWATASESFCDGTGSTVLVTAV